MNDGSIPDALTFDDVLLLPGRSTVLPTEVDTTTNFSRKVKLNVPLASAADPPSAVDIIGIILNWP